MVSVAMQLYIFIIFPQDSSTEKVLGCIVKDFSADKPRCQETVEIGQKKSFMCEIGYCKYSSKLFNNFMRHFEKQHAGELPPFKQKRARVKYELLNSKLKSVLKKLQSIVHQSPESVFKNSFFFKYRSHPYFLLYQNMCGQYVI